MSSFSPDRDLFHLNYASNINQSGNVVLSEVLGIIVPTRPGKVYGLPSRVYLINGRVAQHLFQRC